MNTFCDVQQVVVDSLRLYHSFLHATPWDSSSSSEDDDLLAPLTESEELDRLYIATKNERIKLFTSPSEQKFAPNSKSSNCQERNNSVPNSFLNLVEDSVQETSLEDLFIPVHVSFTDVSSVEPNPANASQLDVAYSMPRRLEALGAVPEEEEENILVSLTISQSFSFCVFCFYFSTSLCHLSTLAILTRLELKASNR